MNEMISTRWTINNLGDIPSSPHCVSLPSRSNDVDRTAIIAAPSEMDMVPRTVSFTWFELHEGGADSISCLTLTTTLVLLFPGPGISHGAGGRERGQSKIEGKH